MKRASKLLDKELELLKLYAIKEIKKEAKKLLKARKNLVSFEMGLGVYCFWYKCGPINKAEYMNDLYDFINKYDFLGIKDVNLTVER